MSKLTLKEAQLVAGSIDTFLKKSEGKFPVELRNDSLAKAGYLLAMLNLSLYALETLEEARQRTIEELSDG